MVFQEFQLLLFYQFFHFICQFHSLCWKIFGVFFVEILHLQILSFHCHLNYCLHLIQCTHFLIFVPCWSSSLLFLLPFRVLSLSHTISSLSCPSMSLLKSSFIISVLCSFSFRYSFSHKPSQDEYHLQCIYLYLSLSRSAHPFKTLLWETFHVHLVLVFQGQLMYLTFSAIMTWSER